jgi:hypothetical protein
MRCRLRQSDLEDMCVCSMRCIRLYARAQWVAKGAGAVVYSECMSAALVIQRAKRMPHIVICGLCDYTIFCHIS